MIRLGLIGAGTIGKTHISNIVEKKKCPGITLTAIADANPECLEWAEQAVPEAKLYVNASDLMNSGVVDAVLIAVPHYKHAELAVEALEHGLHVMCEKPAGVYTLQAREMNAAADRHPELTFGMMFNVRTRAVYRKIKQMLDTGELGEIKRVNWIITDWFRTQYYYDSGDWRATWDGEGGGVLLNQCPHQLDALQWMCGMPVKIRAFAHEGKWHDIEVEDDVTAYMEFPNGATGVFITSTGDAPGTNRLEISGTLGKLVCDSKNSLVFHKLAVDEREWCATSKNAALRPECTVIDVETDRRNGQHAEVLNAFVDHIENGGSLVADGREGLNSLMLSNAMYLSAWTGETVTLPIDEEKFLELLNARRAHSRHKKKVSRSGTVDTCSSFE